MSRKVIQYKDKHTRSVRFQMSKILARRMEEMNVTSQQVADSMGINVKTINNWKSGRSFSNEGVQIALLSLGLEIDVTSRVIGDPVAHKEQSDSKVNSEQKNRKE